MNKILKFLNLDDENIKINYIYVIFLLFSIYVFSSILYDIFRIHIYRHDSLYYMPNASDYLGKVSEEGRWLNYLLFHFVKNVSGSILATFSLLSFLFFIFVSTYKWTENCLYALIVAFLFVQIPSFYALLTWPATSAPSFLVLLFSTFSYKKLNIFIFFILFSILFFGTMSNYYYLLPLLFLSHFKNHTWQENLKYLFFKLIPAWAIGFIIGYATTQLIIYEMFGHLMKIAVWRIPNYIYSFSDFLENINRSVHALKAGIRSIFFNDWFIILFIFSIIVGTVKRKKYLVFIPLFLFISIILIHYIIVLPVGIFIASRTIVATWVGVFAIAFFIPNIKSWQIYLVVPIIVFFTSRLYLNNHHNLQWYENVTNVHYDKLKTESPKKPSEYKGVILYASDKDIQQRNQKISKIYNTPMGANIEGLGSFMRLAPAMWESGFKSVSMCNGNRNSVNDLNKICESVDKLISENTKNDKNNKFFNIHGEYDERLIIEFNKNWNHK